MVQQQNDGMECVIQFIQIPRNQIMYLRFILESYEIIANAITHDNRNGIVELVISPFFVDQMERILKSLEQDFPIRRLPSDYADSDLAK